MQVQTGKQSPERPGRAGSGRFSRTTGMSVALHAGLLLLLVQWARTTPVRVRLPGTADGTHMQLTYAPGKAVRRTAPHHLLRPVAKQLVPRMPVPALAAPASQAQATDRADQQGTQTGKTGNDALGSGEINIALLSFFPTPHPDLAVLPKGTRGDVVLDVTIDATGRITQLTVTKGLGYGIDQSVVATVETWLFHPATRNGQPVASEQELLFHYEKG